MGLFARHHVPGQQIALGVVDPDRLRPAYDAAVARDDADIDMGVRDLRAPPRDDYVRQRGDGGAKADRSTLDGGDHRNGQIEDPIDYRPGIVRHAIPYLGQPVEIGGASCRESVCQYVWSSVLAGSLQKKKKNTD